MIPIKPKDIEIDGFHCIFSKFTYPDAREVAAKYLSAHTPLTGSYKVSQEVMLKLMSFVFVRKEGIEQPIPLNSLELVKAHIPDFETGVLIEKGMLEYNFKAFQNGRASNFLSGIAQNIQGKTTSMLTDSLAQLWTKIKPLSTSSEQSTI